MIFGVYLPDQSEICMKTFCSVLTAQLNAAACFAAVWRVCKCSHQQDGNHVMVLLRFSECNAVFYVVSLLA